MNKIGYVVASLTAIAGLAAFNKPKPTLFLTLLLGILPFPAFPGPTPRWTLSHQFHHGHGYIHVFAK